ncbi:MAG TPA: hypothetical protein VJ725_10245 [Thermoanaerobaculia bacterium]|nr:hypothetical protein [Thermoanaerobaculia bacterium]
MEVVVAALQEVSDGEEGEVVEARTGWRGSRDRCRFLSSDPPDEAVESVGSDAIAEIHPGIPLEEKRELEVGRSARERDRDHGDSTADALDEGTFDLGLLPRTDTVLSHEDSHRSDGLNQALKVRNPRSPGREL